MTSAFRSPIRDGVGHFVQVIEQRGRNITQTHQYLVLMLIATNLGLLHGLQQM